MQISSQTPVYTSRASEPAPAPQKTMVDKIVDKTILGTNYLGSTLSGGVGGLGAYASTAVQGAVGTTASAVTNLWKAETIGPNLKILGTLAAAPVIAAGAVVALPVCAVAGMVHGARSVDSSRPRELTLGQAAVQGFEAGATLGGHIGMAAGKVQGALLGAAVGTVASLPLVAAVNGLVALPLPAMAVVALPVALVGLGLGATLGEATGQVVGAAAGGAVGAAGGTVYHAAQNLLRKD